MNSIEIEKIKKIEFDILCYVDTFCKKNDINYFLAYGTLLGAARHNGFIPWDDDIDIFMPRKDYDKFIELYKNDKSNYKLICYENNKKFYIPFAKVYDSQTPLIERVSHPIKIGVSIDVYPLENIPGDYSKVFAFIDSKYNRVLFKMLTIKNLVFKERKIYKNLILLIGKICLFPIRREIIIKKIIKEISKYKLCESEYVYSLSSINTTKDIFNSELFRKKRMLTFNGKQFPVPDGYEIVLERLYKNYMELPPENERVSHHEFNLL